MGITAEQLERKRTGIGGSEVAALFGLDPHQNELDVWYSKQPDDVVKSKDVDETTEQMEIGNDHEAPLLAWSRRTMERELGLALRVRSNYERRMDCFLIHCDSVFFDVDFLTEAKTAGRPDHPNPLRRWGATSIDSRTDAVPPPTRIQVQSQMMASGKAAALVALLCGTFFCLERRLYQVPADAEMQDMIHARGTAWWQRHIIDGEMPKPKEKDGTAMTPSSSTLDRIVRSPGTWAQIPEEVMETYIAAAAAGTKADKARKAAKKQLLHAAGSCDGARCDENMELPEITLYERDGKVSYGTSADKYGPLCEECGVGKKQGAPFRVPVKRKRTG